jgi:NTP pyrophosphatase (non-canonical NTP hydrolase)
MIDLKEVQERIWANKLAKGFGTTNVEREFNLTYGELAEAYEAYFKGHNTVGEELADVFIYLLNLAKMTNVDLEAEVMAKLGKNESRTYTEQVVNGQRVRLKTIDPEQHGHMPHPEAHQDNHHHGEHHA